MAQKKLFSELVDGGSTATARTLLTFTMPRDGVLFGAYLVQTTAQTLTLQIVRGGTTYEMFETTNLVDSINVPITLNDGDAIRWEVTTGAAGTADAGLFGEYLDAD